jgi:Tfp pilus assembly PilM family ATPase
MNLYLGFIKKAVYLLKPKVEVGGLDINDGGILFLSIDPETNKIKSSSVRLSPGVVLDGKILSKDEFIKALKKLHSQIVSDSNQKIPVVVSISDANVYSQQFELPLLKSTNLQQAVLLNLQVISPIDFSKAYSDWQKIENPKGRGVDILASFIQKEIIDDLVDGISKSNFVPIAIEQKTASLTRTISQLASNVDLKSSFFLLYVSSDGLGFSIIRQGYLYFNRFTPWSVLVKDSKKQISTKEFSETIIQESHRIINFYSSHFNENISLFYVIAPGIESLIKQIVESNFSLKVEPIVLKKFLLEPSWFAALGAALRGNMPRSVDTDISLAPEGTEILFFHSQILSFIKLWRNVIFVVCSIILAVGIGIFIFLNRVTNDIAIDFNKIAGGYNVSYLNALKQQALDFNRSLEIAINAKNQQVQWSKIIKEIYNQAGKEIKIERIFVQSIDLPIIINGSAPNANLAVDFKNKLSSLKFVSDTNLPLSSLNVGEDKTTFTISFRVLPSFLQ